jgi:hypothetical protein
MNKPNYVKCDSCAWQLEQYPERDWIARPCLSCHNTRQVPEPKDILCNMCGECSRPIGTSNEQYHQGLEAVEVKGGYESYHLSDMTTYKFTFCEKCLRQMFMKCKIKPIVNDSDYDILPWDPPIPDGSSLKWERDQEAYEYRIWKDTGGHHQAYLDRKCNAVTKCPNKAIYTRRLRGDFTEDCCCEDHKFIRAYGNSTLVQFIPNVLKPFL